MTTPRDGDSFNTYRDKGYSESANGEIRTPWGQSVSGWNGSLKNNGGTVSDN